jgi:hypothetical protein
MHDYCCCSVEVRGESTQSWVVIDWSLGSESVEEIIAIGLLVKKKKMTSSL